MSKVKITLDEQTYDLEVDPAGDSVLQYALDEGLDAPYSCQGGVCTTCKAKKISGEVEMDVNFALTDGEIKEGYILTCQSHPVTDELEITYDIY